MSSAGVSSAVARVIRGLGRVVQPMVPRTERGIAILAYHLVEGGTDSPVDVPLARFREQLQQLAKTMPVIGLGEALERAGRGDDSQVAAITFDDAFLNFAERALPVLEELEMPALLYVPVDFVDGQAGSPLRGAEQLAPCSWEVLGQLAAHPLVEIGSHTCSHPELTALPLESADQEIRRSRERLEQELGVAVTSFCYPRGLWSVKLEQQVAATYDSAVVGHGTRNLAGRLRPHRLGRCPVRRDTPPDLGPILTRGVWTEEWVADAARQLRL